MDHSKHMGHAMEDHSGHGGHGGGGGMGDMCSMNMLFNWDTDNLCIVFRQWHIRNTPQLIGSLITVVAIAMGYEALRSVSRRYESYLASRLETTPNADAARENVTESTPFFNRPGQLRDTVSERGHFVKALLYAFQNFYAFMLMLVFMTYNGWVMIAVSLGAFLGYIVFGKQTSATKDNACH